MLIGQGRERNIHQLPPAHAPTWSQAYNPFGAQDDAPTSWATQPGRRQYVSYFKI